MADPNIPPAGVPVAMGMANPPTDSLEENLVDRLLFAEECCHAANILINHYVAKYGGGILPVDAAKGQKGVLSFFRFMDRDRLDIEINYLLKSFIFSAKSSIDKGLHLVYVMRTIVQPGKIACGMPDPLRPKGFGRFFEGLLGNKFDNFNPLLAQYYAKWAETIIHLRLIRNNVKEFGKANFEINMGRPCWKFALTAQNISDGTLKHSSVFQASKVPVTNLTMTVDFLYSVAAGEVDHLYTLAQVADIEKLSNGLVNAAALARVNGLVDVLDRSIEQHALRLDIPTSAANANPAT